MIYPLYTRHIQCIYFIGYPQYIQCIYMTYAWYILVAGVAEEDRGAGARLPTCGAAPTYCHAGTATRAHPRARGQLQPCNDNEHLAM